MNANNSIKRARQVLLIALFCLPVVSHSKDITDPENCLGCHEDATVQGVHSGHQFGLTNLVADCADCHKSIGTITEHKDGALDVIRYVGNSENVVEPSNIEAQNNACLNCHEPKILRLSQWTHDAHGYDLACASCHSLHPKNDPVRGISNKATIKLCVDCHAASTASKTLLGEGDSP